jgi:exonuclease VII large subunit
LQGLDSKVGKLNYLLGGFPMYIEKISSKIDGFEKLFLSYNPKNVLKKGYAFITDEEGKVLSDTKGLTVGQNVNINLAKASILTNILKIIKK